MSKGLWYMAHPYTAKDANGNFVPEAEEANFNLANHRAAEMMKRGYNVYSPISHTHPIHRACPEFLKNHEHEMWYGLDVELMERCNFDGIILAPGWEQSKGCMGEMKWMDKQGKVIHKYENLLKEPVVYGCP